MECFRSAVRTYCHHTGQWTHPLTRVAHYSNSVDVTSTPVGKGNTAAVRRSALGDHLLPEAVTPHPYREQIGQHPQRRRLPCRRLPICGEPTMLHQAILAAR